MKKYEKLTSHPFFSKNFEYIKPIIEKTHPEMMNRIRETGKIRNDKTEQLENSEYYHVTVFFKASAITSAVERLENSLVYINKFPNPRLYERQGIHQFSWLEYHYSYFVVTYNSLIDMALILTNAVFRLGLLEKDCKKSVVKDNSWVKKTSVKPALTSLEKATQNYSNIRNLFVHRGEMPDVKSATDSDMLDLLKLYSTVNQHPKPIVPQDILDKMYKLESKTIVSKLDSDITKAQEAISYFFDTLLPIYKNKSSEISLLADN